MPGRKYARPPLLEARCEVVLTGGEWTDDTPFTLRTHLAESFPRWINTPVGETKARVVMSRHDDSQTVQVFPDKIVVSQLRPYPGFEVWRPLVLDMAELHKAVIGSRRAERIGVRYVNRIALPNRHVDVSRYVRVDSSLTNGFRRRVTLKPFHSGHELIATVGSPNSKRGKPSMLLDLHDRIDAGDCGDLRDLGRCLDEAHENVDVAFESMVTPEARDEFEEIRP